MRPLRGKNIFNVTSSEIGASSNVQSLQPPHVLAFHVQNICAARVIQQTLSLSTLAASFFFFLGV